MLYLCQAVRGLEILMGTALAITHSNARENSCKSAVAQASKPIEMRKLTLADCFMPTLAVVIVIGFPVGHWFASFR